MEHDILYDDTPVWKLFVWAIQNCRDNFQTGNVMEGNRFADMSLRLEEIVDEFKRKGQ